MLTLGINQDLYDCGVAVSDGEKLLYAAGEERFSREKNTGGVPRQALAGLFAHTGLTPGDVDRVVMVGEMTPPLPARALPDLQAWVFRARRVRGDSVSKRIIDLIAFDTPLTNTSLDSFSRRLTKPLLAPLVRRQLPAGLRKQPLAFVEHHRAHAASAYFLSGFKEAVVVTADGMGDGVSSTISRAGPEGIRRLWSASARDSFGIFFETITEALGFIPSRDEGKLMALAAHGDPSHVAAAAPFRLEGDRLLYGGPRGRAAISWIRGLIDACSREDVCAWAQDQLESCMARIVGHWLRETGLRRLAAAGGVFANVKLNQRLHALREVDEIFVCPNMGDGGLSLGAICALGGFAPTRLPEVFWGDGYSEAAIEEELRNAGVGYRRSDQIERDTADRIAAGFIVARFSGRMEWGPRALGNRSILASAAGAGITDRLNRLLSRNDFMPFAPACLSEDADDFVVGADGARHAAEFMTTCFPCTPAMKAAQPAAVHVDGTARLQMVRAEFNPGFHALLTEYKKLTGHGIVINTSMNIHHEPIVRTPREAIRTFAKGRLDYLAAGPFLVDGAHIRHKGPSSR